MKLFRAVPAGSLEEPAQVHRRHPGRRLPSNIPYFIDNLWEYARPAGMPSRRHAIYASPTAELALVNASAGMLERSGYQVCELVFHRAPKQLQLNVPDARDHKDVRALKWLVSSKLPKDWPEYDLEDKRGLEPLFMPGVMKSEIKQRLNWDPLFKEIVTSSLEMITLWSSTPTNDGEYFFEIEDDNFYHLHPIT